MEGAVLQIYVGPAKHRWALRGRLPDQNRLLAHAEESWCFHLLATESGGWR